MGINAAHHHRSGAIDRWLASKRLSGSLARMAKAVRADAPAAAAGTPLEATDQIIRRAREMRAAAVSHLIGRAFAWIHARMERARQSEQDAFLAQSVDSADFERRLRQLQQREAL